MPKHITINYPAAKQDGSIENIGLPAEDLALLSGSVSCGYEDGEFAGINADPERWSKVVWADNVCDGCNGTNNFHVEFRDGDGNTLIVDGRLACPKCHARAIAKDILPVKYKWVDYRFLTPSTELPYPVPLALQQKLIDQIKGDELIGHTVLFSGPSQCGKTTLASALLQRMVEHYLALGFEKEYPRHKLPIYRVRANEWLDAYHKHNTHNYDSSAEAPPLPELNLSTVTQLLPKREGDVNTRECPEEFPPVIVVEEIEKFTITETRLNTLFAVLDAAAEAGGMIICTSNLEEKEMQARYPDYFYSRIVRSNKDGKVRHRDYREAMGITKKPAKKRKAA